MIEFYPQIKFVHITAVLLSGAVFLVRGMLVMRGRQSWALSAPARFSSYTIDTVLLTAALMLVSILPREMFANGWLAAKLVLLIPYVVLGSYALKRGRTPAIRLTAYVLALGAYGLMYSIARAHHPLGLLWRWMN